MKAILVCHQVPQPLGHGGNRRAYQIRMQLEEELGPQNVLVSDNPWRYLPEGIRRFPFYVRQVLGPLFENPLKLVSHTCFTRRLFALPRFQAHYLALLRGIQGPVISIVEHPGFSSLLPINARLEVPTIACNQNLEAFDMSDGVSGKWAIHAKALDFANEVEVLARCDHRLFISKVEAGLMGGLGLPGSYYPYLPVGAIRERLEKVRHARSRGTPEGGLFLMLGTVGRESTRTSFGEFLHRARVQGLPKDVRVVVAGLNTETLIPPQESIGGVDIRGWLGEDELDTLLARVSAVVVPQRQGFGALTRLPELSCAGVPILVSRHATYALDPPPGTEIVDDEWDAWCGTMDEHSRGARVVAAGDYRAWEAAQPRPLAGVVRRLAATR